jgi:hypothetical protein
MTPYAFAILFIFFALVLASQRFGVFSITKIQNEGLTSTITASTEALSFSLQEDRQSSWILPAGMFLVTTIDPPEDEDKDMDCSDRIEHIDGTEHEDGTEHIDNDFLIGYQCAFGSNARLEINGAAEVAVMITPAGNLRLTVKPHGKSPLDVRVDNAEDESLFPPQLELGYETTLPAKIPNSEDIYQVRVPLIATSAQVGSHLHYVSTVDTSPDDFWQPALLSGNVSIIARNHPDFEKFDVLNEALDTGDVLGIGRNVSEDEQDDESKPDDEYKPDDEKTDLVWGVATIGRQATTLSGTTEIDQFMIHVVLHTTHRQLSVRRFGTRGTRAGHIVAASRWSILSRWPNGQKAWVSFVTAAFLLTTILALGECIRDNPLSNKKKNRKGRGK